MVRLIIYIYSMQTFINKSLNKASREKNLTKSKTLGPFAAVLGQIVQSAAENRDVINKITPLSPVNLFRGLTLTKQEISEFIDICN